MPVKLFAIGLAGLFALAPSSAPGFQGRISKTSAAELEHSWRPGCPVGPSQLRRLDVSYWGFDRKRHAGSLVVHSSAAKGVVSVFRRLYGARFPIRRLRLVEAYRGSDDASMAADNTSGFNCRRVKGSTRWSDHAFGAAIDLNPVENPDLTGSSVAPPGSRRFAALDRAPGALVPDGAITADDLVVRAFAAIGWEWGGSWGNPDFQHFTGAGARP